MRKGLAAYLIILVVAIFLEYVIELRFSTKLALEANPLVPWVLGAVLYTAYGVAAALALRSWRLSHRVYLLALLSVLPHIALEITLGSDQAYPYLGMFLMIADLLWVAIGAAIATAIVSRREAIQRPS